MPSDTFIHKGDLVYEINKLGALHDIKEESINTQNIFMLCCANKNERCDAKIIGMYSQKDKLFHIKRIDSVHTCQKNIKRDIAIQSEVKRICKNPSIDKNINTIEDEFLKIGKIVETLYTKLKIGYFEVFKTLNELNNGFLINKYTNFDENKENNPDSLFINENKTFDYDSYRDNVISYKTEDSLSDCLHYLKEEFISQNPHIKCIVNRTNFFFKHMQMEKVLRKIVEIKIYQRSSGTMILGLLFDPSNEHVIQSCLISEESKIIALEVFIENNKQCKSGDDSPFYIIDLDFEIIEFLSSKNIPFFIKTRSIFQYLHESKEDDLNSLAYFNEINYGEREFLDIDKKQYLKRFCPVNIHSLGDAYYPDFEFITPSILNLPLIDCITSMIWLISDDIKSRKILNQEDYDSSFPEALIDYFDEIKDIVPSKKLKVDLESCECECGKFQENLFPCVHAYHEIIDMKKDPLLYVSNVYNKENMQKIKDIVPVVNIKIHPFGSKVASKKKRGDTDDDL